MFPDPGGGKLKQLCMKGTLHKSCLTLERESSDHRRAMITKKQTGPTLLSTMRNTCQFLVSINLCLSIKDLWGGWHQKLRQQQPNTQGCCCLPQVTHQRAEEEKSWEKKSLRGLTSQHVFLCQFNNRQASYKVNSFPLMQPLLHALTHAIITESPAWVWWAASLVCTYAVPLQSYFCMHHPLCQRHCHWGDTPFSLLFLHCLSSGGPTWSELFYRALPTNQAFIQSVPPWNCHKQWRSTNSHQLQYSPDVLTRSVPLAIHNNCKIDIRFATNLLPASAVKALSSSGQHCLECTCWAVHSRGHCTATTLVPFSCTHSLPRAFLSLLDLREGRSSHRRAGSAQRGLRSFPEHFLTRSVCDQAWAGIPADILTSASIDFKLQPL